MMTIYSVEYCSESILDDTYSSFERDRMFMTEESAQKYVREQLALSDSLAEKRARLEELGMLELYGRNYKPDLVEEMRSLQGEFYEKFGCIKPHYIIVAREVYD